MKKTHKLQIFALCGLLLLIASCSQVMITGRKQLNLISDEAMLSMSMQAYNEFLSENELSDNAADCQKVKYIGQRISSAVETYLEQNNLSTDLEACEWEFNLVKNSSVNAWAMPGGKIVVYTGMLPITESEAGLATVISHEIAHVIARHGSERMTQALLVQMGGMALDAALEEKPEKTQELFAISYAFATTLGLMLPYSRVQENEADHLGLIFMAMAGYDPHEAVNFWQRMSDTKQEEGSPLWEFLSTHPADKTRIKNIEELIPKAMAYYREAK